MGAMHITLHRVGKLLWEEKLQLECPKFLNKGPKMTSQIVLNHSNYFLFWMELAHMFTIYLSTLLFGLDLSSFALTKGK